MIGVVDYGLGNLRSVHGAVERLGHTCVVSADPTVLADSDKLILPGVGAFGDGMRNLRDAGLVDPLTELVQGRRMPILGICLGFQLLAETSEEFGEHTGLAWIPGRVVRLQTGDPHLRVPHVGWNEFHRTHDCVLFDDVPDDALFYYVHSFRLETDPNVEVGTCPYGSPVTAAFQKGNVFGTQFHPEKSQRHGMTVLNNFLERA